MLARLRSCTELPAQDGCRAWRAEVDEDRRTWTVDILRTPGGAFRFEWVGDAALDANLAGRIKGHARRYVKWLLARELADVAIASGLTIRGASRS